MVGRNENQPAIEEREIPTMTLVRSSRGKYLIGTQGYEIESKSSNIPPHVYHDMIDAGLTEGRNHYESKRRLPGKMTVSLPGRVFVSKTNHFKIDLN